MNTRPFQVISSPERFCRILSRINLGYFRLASHSARFGGLRRLERRTSSDLFQGLLQGSGGALRLMGFEKLLGNGAGTGTEQHKGGDEKQRNGADREARV